VIIYSEYKCIAINVQTPSMMRVVDSVVYLAMIFWEFCVCSLGFLQLERVSFNSLPQYFLHFHLARSLSEQT